MSAGDEGAGLSRKGTPAASIGATDVSGGPAPSPASGDCPDLADALGVALVGMFSETLDTWLDEVRLHLNKRARGGCWCFSTVKPCEVHDAYDDGICDLIDALQGIKYAPSSGRETSQ